MAVSHPETEVHYDSDWTAIYVVLAVIPAVFVCVALYSKWHDRVMARKRDLEAAK
jgi:hypothetical protein